MCWRRMWCCCPTAAARSASNLRPVVSADHVARFVIGIQRKLAAGVPTAEPALVNGRPGALIYLDGELNTVITVEVEGDRISRIYLVRNPDKVGSAAAAQALRR